MSSSFSVVLGMKSVVHHPASGPQSGARDQTPPSEGEEVTAKVIHVSGGVHRGTKQKRDDGERRVTPRVEVGGRDGESGPNYQRWKGWW